MSYVKILLILLILIQVALGISPHADRTTWFLENAPVFIILPYLFYLHPRIQITKLTFTVLFVHAIVLIVGGHYSYAEVPAGFWVQEAFGFERNHYDRLGHFMQGFGPAIALRELLLKQSYLKTGKLLSLIVLSMCLAFSALYELIEWWAAVLLGQGADAFLGTQGDVWDTQWDMFLAMIGATVALAAFSKLQDHYMAAQRHVMKL